MTEVLTSSIIPAKYNPKLRVQNITPLMGSIRDHGIIIPLVIDANNNLVDGHRRLASARKLGIMKVPVIRLDSTLPKDKAYEIINSTAQRISGKDYIYIHINGGTVPNKAVIVINQLKDVVGDKGLKRLADLGISYRVGTYAHLVRRYCHQKSDNFLKRTIFWLAENGMSFAVRRAMDNKVDKKVILNAIATGRPLKLTYK